jgi:hypothetical protein
MVRVFLITRYRAFSKLLFKIELLSMVTTTKAQVDQLCAQEYMITTRFLVLLAAVCRLHGNVYQK